MVCAVLVTHVHDLMDGMAELLIAHSVRARFIPVVINMTLFTLLTGTCPTGTAWVDKAYAVDQAHQVMECSNAGICDRKSGLCRCFEGFTGTACQRSMFSSACLFFFKC